MLACACILEEEHERDDMTFFYSPPGTFFKKKKNSKAYALLPTLRVRCFLYEAEEHEDFCALSPRHARLYFTYALHSPAGTRASTFLVLYLCFTADFDDALLYFTLFMSSHSPAGTSNPTRLYFTYALRMLYLCFTVLYVCFTSTLRMLYSTLFMSAHSPAGTSHPTRLYNDQV